MSVYNSTINELQSFVTQPLVLIIESGKLACADTQNRTLFKMLDFRRSDHILSLFYCTYLKGIYNKQVLFLIFDWREKRKIK